MNLYYINARGTSIQLPMTHPIFHIENSIIKIGLEWGLCSKEQPFYIDIDSNSFHTILTYLNCQQEASSGVDEQAKKYLRLLEKEIETNPILLYSMNKLAILDDITHKTQWSCSLDNRLDIIENWDEISGFVYIVNMLCENKYKNKYFCINKFGIDKKNYCKKSIPILDIVIRDSNNNTVNLLLGRQNECCIKKINDDELYNYIEKFGKISDFTKLFNDINELMPGCNNISKRYI